MDSFLEPFLEKGYSLGKIPISENVNADSNIKFLQKVIFKHDVLLQFKEVLNLACSTEPFTVKNDIIKKLINDLSKLLLSGEDVNVKTNVFCRVFESFAVTCKGDESVQVIQFFLVLSHVLGLNNVLNEDNKKTQDSCDKIINVENFQNAFQVDTSAYSSDSLQIFKELLKCLSKTSVNLHSPEILSYNKWLQQLLKNLSQSQPFQNILMDILLLSGELDLKLLEGNLENIFSNILAQRLPLEESFCDSYRNFLESALNIFFKFQRIVKFITKFIGSIKVSPTELTKEVILPSNFTVEFSKSVALTSNQQCLSLLEILIESVDECVSEILNRESELKLILLLDVASELLICFLKEVKLFAPSIASTTLQAFINNLSIFKNVLKKFGDYLFSNKSFMLKNKGIVEIYLRLCFYCGEIQMLINCYKDTILQPVEPSGNSEEFCLSLDQWEKLINFILKSKLETCGSVCFKLALQKLRIYKLEKEISEVDDSTLKILIHQLSLDLEQFNILQEVSPEDLTIVIQNVTAEESKSIAKNILKQILENEDVAESDCWLSSSTLQENAVFIASLFSVLLNETGSLLPEKILSRYSWLLEEYFDDENRIRSESLERLPEKINTLLKNVKKTRKTWKKSSEEKGKLRRIVEAFKLLPLPQMKNEIRSLGLSFAVGVGTLLTGDEESARSAFESVCGFLASDVDASTCFDIGLCIQWLSELSCESPRTNDLKVKVVEGLVRNSPNMKFGLSQVGEMIDSTESSKNENPLKMLEARVVLYNELGKCWQRAKKRKSDNDLIGSFRSKLAKMISEEAKEVEEEEINSENRKMFLKIFGIELNKASKSKDEKEMESLMEQKFTSYFDFAVKNLKKDFDEPSATFLTVVLQSVPQLRKFLPQDSVLKIWKSLRSHEKVNWRLFSLHSTDKEFEEILDDLLILSKKFLNSNKHSSNCFEIWVSFFEFSTETKRNLCQVRLQEFFGYIHECHLFLRDLEVKKKIFLIKFFSFCLNNKEVVVTSHVLDTIIHVILECLDETSSVQDFHDLFTAEIEVVSAVLSRQFVWSKSKVHLTFVVFKRMLNSLMTRCNGAGQEVNKNDVIMLSTCGFCLEKWVSLTVKKEKDFARTSAYFITALISSMASVTVLPPVKIHLINCVNHFLSISDSHTVAYLMRVLKPGYQQVFNTVYNQFKKYHKYSGKI